VRAPESAPGSEAESAPESASGSAPESEFERTLERSLERALEGLADELAAGDPDRRRAAGGVLLSALRAHAERSENGCVLKHIAQGSATLRALTAWALRHLPDEGYSALLMALLNAPERLAERLALPEALLTRALRATAPKARQAAARALSAHPAALWSPALCEATLGALAAEEAHFVRASLLLALGRCPDPRARAALRDYAPRGPREADALALARAAAPVAPAAPLNELPLNELPLNELPLNDLTLSATHVTLLTAPGLEAPLAEELTEAGWGDVGLVAPLSGLVRAAPPVALRPLRAARPAALPRCARALCAPLARAALSPSGSAHERALALLAAWGASEEGAGGAGGGLAGEVRYRAASPAHDPRQRRAFARAAREAAEARGLGWREAPSDYNAQLLPHAPAGGPEGWLLLTLEALGAAPASYRRRDVGASMSREVASAVARWARREAARGGARDEGPYTLLDPTCGSGTLLYERALLGLPAGGVARGVDVSAVALRAAQENLAALRALPEGAALPPVTLHAADSREAHAWVPFDEALMNLPFGGRVSDARGARGAREALAGLYGDLLARAAEHARPGALLVAYSTQRQLLATASAAAGWRAARAERLLAGGLWVELWALRRR